MRTTVFLLSAAAVAAVLFSCSPLTTRWDYDPDADFARYRTFAWMPDAETSAGARSVWDNPFLGKRVKQAVVVAMARKGLERSDDQPDLLIAFRLDVTRKTGVHVPPYPYWGRPNPAYWGPYPAGTERYREGTLIIDLVDARTRRLVWRGWGIGEFDTAARPASAQEYVSAAVAGILKHYPPYRTSPRQPPAETAN